MTTIYGYQIIAHSPSMNERIQEIDLADDIVETEQMARRRADTWAQRLNQEQRLQAQDWVGQINPITHPGSQGIQPNTIVWMTGFAG